MQDDQFKREREKRVRENERERKERIEKSERRRKEIQMSFLSFM